MTFFKISLNVGRLEFILFDGCNGDFTGEFGIAFIAKALFFDFPHLRTKSNTTSSFEIKKSLHNISISSSSVISRKDSHAKTFSALF